MFNKKKFNKAILYLVSKFPNGKLKGLKKLAKLLYFADFDFFEIHEVPITGATYRAKKMGPYPDQLDDALDELRKKEILKVGKEKNLGLENDTVIFEINPKIKIDSLSWFNEKERTMLDSVYQRYGGLSGTDLEIISHNEAPFNAVNRGEVLPYELSFYRDKEKEILGSLN